MNEEIITPRNTLIVVALEDELPTKLAPDWSILYTGVGKINAAIKATEAVLQNRPSHLINYGTAGALNTSIYGLTVNRIVRHDMDIRPLGFNWDTRRSMLSVTLIWEVPVSHWGLGHVTTNPSSLLILLIWRPTPWLK